MAERGRDDRERRRAGSAQRDAQHRSGGSGTSLALPPGIELFQPKASTYRFDIVPYVLGKNNLYCRDVGALYWECTYYVHGGVGPNNDRYCCPNKMKKQPCPVCEHRAELERKGKPDRMTDAEWKKYIGAFLPKERQLFLINLRGDEDKLMLFDFSHHNFGKLLDKMRKNADEDQDYIRDFDDDRAGSILKASFSEEKGGGYTFFECYSIEFKARPNGLNPELLDHGICLDSIPIVVSYEELKKAFHQVAETEDDEDDEKPKGKAKSDDWDDDKPAPKKEEGKKEPKKQEPPDDTPTADSVGIKVGSTVRHRQKGILEVIAISPDGTSLKCKDEEGEIVRAVGVEDVKLFGKEKKPDPIKEEPKKTTVPSKTKDDDWDDEPPMKPAKKETAKKDDDWDDDEPPKKSEKKSTKKDADDWD